MTETTYRRAVSGGIVTGADVIDAEFETVEAGRGGTEPTPRTRAAPAEGLRLLTRQPLELRRARGQRGGPAFWTAGLSIAAGAFWAAGGHVLFAAADFGLAAETAPKLRVASFASRIDEAGGRPILMVDGELANDGRAAAPVPPFSIDITTADGLTTRYYLGQSGRSIAPDGRFRFSSRLVAPGQAVESVTITLEAAPKQKKVGA